MSGKKNDNKLESRARREFLKVAWKIGKYAALSSIPIINSTIHSGCDRKTTFEPDEPEPPVQVNLQFDVYNHTQGLQTSFTKNNVTSETSVILNIADIMRDYGVKGVDLERIAIRQENFGSLIAFSRNGEANFTAPRQNTDYDIFLMNTSGITKSEHYQKIDDWVDRGEGILGVPRDATWHREDRDNKTGPPGPINSATQQLHDALQYPWYNYGSLSKVSSGGNFGVGYAEWEDKYAWHSGTWAGVNPDRVEFYIGRLRLFISEIFELITSTNNLANELNTYTLITNSDGTLNQIGKELFAYVYVKDEKTASSSSKFRFSIGFK